MNEAIDFETYLVISHEKFEIFLLDRKNLKNLYQEEFKVEADKEEINFDLLSEFLTNNVFKIEKLVGNFVNNVNVIIENKSTLSFDITMKKKNYSGNINRIFLENMLTDIKDLFKNSYNEHKLIHMLINRYMINGESFSSLRDEINSNEICLEIKLISISNLILFEIENILKKYQIQVNNYLDKGYVKGFIQDEKLDISQKAYNLLNGMNKNEVLITSKSSKKLGFFEKFFQLFS
tara:strand:- start:295 stop:999 length:705 start_codon:yes stop_codon:yes gene_type:complete